MKKLTLALGFATCLFGSACSQKKPTVQEPTPGPNTEEVKSRMEAQQQAIKNASDQREKQQTTATPTPSPTAP